MPKNSSRHDIYHTHTRHRPKQIVTAAVLLALSSPAALAASTTFTGSQDNDWTNPANWTLGVPLETDTAVIDSNIISNTDVNLAAKLIVGISANGSLSITDSIFATESLAVELGSSALSSGTLNVSNTGSFINSGNVEIGRSGLGYLILDGGILDGKNYRIGTRSGGYGKFHIQSGTATLSNELRVASDGGSVAELVVDGGQLLVPTLSFGYQGTTTSSLILNDGLIDADKLQLGRSANSYVTIELEGGVLEVDTLTNVGGDGAETVNITSGILRLQQASRAAFDTLVANGSLNWAPGNLYPEYDPVSADETLINENGTLYIRNDEDGYFSVWSTSPNNKPEFTESPLLLPNAEVSESFNASLADKVTDADVDDILTFTLVSGPSWLTLDADGTVSGTPTLADAGANNFFVEVSDGNATISALLKVWVVADETLVEDNFDSDFGNWIDGGNHARIAQGNCVTPDCVNLQSSGDASSITLNSALALSQYDDVNVSFSFMPKSFEGTEGFSLLYSKDGGVNWITAKAFVNNVDFTNNIRQTLTLSFTNEDLEFSDNALFRFEANGSGDGDDVYIDDIRISAKTHIDTNNAPVFAAESITGNDAIDTVAYEGSLTSFINDVDGDTLTFTKLDGPDWLIVNADGTLAGTPNNSDIGVNSFNVLADDGLGGLAFATLNIEVYATTGGGFALRTFDDFDSGALNAETGIDTRFGNWLDGGTHARIANSNCVVQDCANIQSSGEEATITLAEGLDLTDFNSVKIGFNVKTWGMTSTDDGFFIEHSSDGGITWNTIETLRQGSQFTNEIPTSFEFVYTKAEIEFNDNALFRFRADGYGSGDDIYLDNIATSVAYINYLPVFNSDPLTLANAAKDWDYSASIAHLVSDRNGDPLTFTKVAGPDWLVVNTDGSLSGIPALDDVGANSFTIQADDGAGGVTTATFNIEVDLSLAPSFSSEQLTKPNAIESSNYSASITADASDPDGDALSFSKVDGPSWLVVDSDGSLSGVPSVDDIGINTFTFEANDGLGGTDTASLTIYVASSLGGYPQFKQVPSASEWSLSFDLTDYQPASSINSDGDELNNLEEYAYGGNPQQTDDISQLRNVTINGFNYTVEHTRLRNAKSLGIKYQFQVAADSNNPHWLDVRPDDVHVELLNNSYEKVTYSGVLPFAHRASGIGRVLVSHTGPFAEHLTAESGAERTHAELVLSDHITTKSGNIYEDRFGFAAPQGIVDNASPWMHVRIPFPGDPDWHSDRGTRLYHAELINAAGGDNLINEAPKRWSFFNPYQKLAKGTYTWRAGHSTIDDPDNIEWLNESYQFEIDGTEEQYVPPSADDVWNMAQAKGTPKLLMAENDLFDLLYHDEVTSDNTDQAVINHVDGLIVTRTGNAHDVLNGKTKLYTVKKLKEEQIAQLVNDGYINQDRVSDITETGSDGVVYGYVRVGDADGIAKTVLAYGASGDTNYRDSAIEPLSELWTAALDKQVYGKCIGSGFGIRKYLGMAIAFLDIMPNELSASQKTTLVNDTFDKAYCTPEGFESAMIDKYEHENYESHIVQKVVHILMFAGLAINDHGDRLADAKELFKYAYELWLYKGPHGGRSDGSWHNGFGYMSVNEDQLTATPWILSQLTGFDYMMHPWYRNNAKATSYLRAYGNPGQYYGDKANDAYGITTGGPAAQISRLHAYTHPENRWMRWQTQHQGSNSLLAKPKKMADEWQRWFFLPVSKHHEKPDFVNVLTPLATSDAYRDVGYVAAHSDITDSANNFMTTMRSSPFSSSHKSHASQNAFTTAYGGLPLFYRTGWRKKGDMSDYTDSKAFNLIMPNGESQKRRDKSAYAFLPRFAHGDRMSYWIGDASNTYSADSEVYRFRRHMVHLKPNILVVYDEIESTNEDTNWTYTLNAHNEINALSGNLISVHNTKGLATANLFSSSALTAEVLGPTNGHWNSRMTTTEQMPAVRFLNVIELTPSTDVNEVAQALPAFGSTGTVMVNSGTYMIEAELDPNKPASLKVNSSDGNVALLYAEGVNTLNVNGEAVLRGRYDSSTLFMEKNTPRGDIVEELVDELPDSITYSNKY